MSSGLRLLLEPYELAGVELRNRVVSTSHASGFAEGGIPGERYIAYHEEKARGGVGLTMFGGSSIVSPEVSSIYRQIDVGNDDVIPHFREFARRIHRHGSRLVCQISHMGRRTAWDDGDWIVPISPSAERDPAHHAVPRAMEADDIERVIADYGTAARRCAEGGLDGVEVMVSSHLPGQFLSPESNRRTDEWGGPLENRMRFLRRVMEEIRRCTPPGFWLSLRMSIDESWEGGADADECLTVARTLRDAGLYDLVNVNGIAALTTRGLARVIGGMGVPLAPYLAEVAAFRSAIGAPVLHASRIADPATAVHALESGAVDLVGMTRALVADPHLVRKLESGTPERVRPCVGAAYCIDRIYMGRDAFCAHNPATGRETWLPHTIEPSPGPKRRVVVVGGGPAGMEAARVARRRGHDVVLFEASDRLGGQVVIAARAAWRHDLRGITAWLGDEIGALGVDVRLGTAVGAAEVLAERPDVVVVATGGSPRVPEIEGADLTASAWDVLAGQVQVGGRVLVFDGEGRHGAISVAQHLAERGSTVVLATPDRLVGRELGGSSYPVYLGALARAGVTLMTDRHLTAVRRDDDGALRVALRHEYGETTEVHEVDTVVTQLGTSPIDDVFHALRHGAVNGGTTEVHALRDGRPQPWFTPDAAEADGYLLFRVGDAVASRDIHAALLDSLRLLKDC